MILSSTSRWTHQCPLAPLNTVRWTIGVVAAASWFRVGFTPLDHDTMMWTLVSAVIATQLFGTLSAGMLMLRPRLGIVQRLTDWYAIVASVMTWVLGSGAIVLNGIALAHVFLLLGAVAVGVSWLLMVYFGLRPIHLGAIERE
jgi:hypothetical protein